MILEQTGAHYYHSGTDWIIGGKIVVTDGDYKGLNGILLSVRDGEDMDTGNEGPDFYCSLQPPALPNDLEIFERHMSHLYGTYREAKDIPLDMVILSPDELEPVKKERPKLKLYVVNEEWAANDTSGADDFIFTDFRMAKACLNDKLGKEMEDGCIADWANDPQLVGESDATSYECYIDGIYSEKHYAIGIFPMELELSEEAFKTLGEAYISKLVGERMHTCIHAYLSQEGLCEKEIRAITQKPEFIKRIRSELAKKCEIRDTHSQIISEETFSLIQKLLKEHKRQV